MGMGAIMEAIRFQCGEVWITTGLRISS